MERLSAHIAIAEHFAATDAQDNDNTLWTLWRGEDGETGAALLADITASAAQITHDRDSDYPEIFNQLIAGAVVRRTAPAHPRIAILGPLEARLQSADVVILGGLNEGVWPRDAAIDPFLSRPMRKNIGLPSPERRIGLSAHDFAQLSVSGEVMLTRAIRMGSAPAKPSRWIVRLENILKSVEWLGDIDATNHFAQLTDRLDAPGIINTAPAPMPRPPAPARPRALSVTRIEKLLRDPYAIYAGKILRLEKLRPPGADFGPAERGQLLHKVFEDYTKRSAAAGNGDGLEALHAIFARHADGFGYTPAHAAFWRARITDALQWFVVWDHERRTEGAPALIEASGALTINAEGGPFKITARADRIDRLKDGALFIIDYKTGPPPTLKQTQKFSPQLPLTGLIAREGGFSELGPAAIGGFDYVRVLGRGGSGKDNAGAMGGEAEDFINEAEAGLRQLIAHFDDPASGYPSQPRPEYVDQYGDYDHLARRRERESTGGEE